MAKHFSACICMPRNLCIGWCWPYSLGHDEPNCYSAASISCSLLLTALNHAQGHDDIGGGGELLEACANVL